MLINITDYKRITNADMTLLACYTSQAIKQWLKTNIKLNYQIDFADTSNIRQHSLSFNLFAKIVKLQEQLIKWLTVKLFYYVF